MRVVFILVQQKKPDCDLTDGVVDKELVEETDSDEEVIEDGAEEGILGPEEADMLNNQELEGDCNLVEHMLEITDYTPLSSEVEQGGDIRLDTWSKTS